MCVETITAYALRAIGIGERLLPKSDISMCEQIVLVGSGLMWNIYFATFALGFGFFLATFLALAKFGQFGKFAKKVSSGFVFFFRGTPLFLQFFFAYELFVLLPKLSVDIPLGFTTITAETRWLTKAWLGAALVLFFNTAAYSAEIFFGALRAIPKGQIEAGEALGLSGWQRFRFIVWPTMLRYAWPAYTNESIFLFHATTLVYFSSFPTWRQQGDALYYANYFAEKTFNPFVAYPLIAAYFILITLALIFVYGRIGKRLGKHLDSKLNRH